MFMPSRSSMHLLRQIISCSFSALSRAYKARTSESRPQGSRRPLALSANAARTVVSCRIAPGRWHIRPGNPWTSVTRPDARLEKPHRHSRHDSRFVMPIPFPFLASAAQHRRSYDNSAVDWGRYSVAAGGISGDNGWRSRKPRLPPGDRDFHW
ncbi:hypothetical protein F5148DRAFT_213495 [Russula earlei]|uniref:Uncharacterized protein n=1 Tax=Russula earlei TaxID=71964 RepID=A0ACC0U4U8_9AGAM|nr:hypothetical protein F5148DRAFT_213495 [Russula earlei]